MKKIFIVVFILFIIFLLSSLKKKGDDNAFKEKEIYSYIDTSNVYLAFKGTDTKPGEIAKKYNISNTKVSHVGILFYRNTNWEIVHVTNVKKNGNNLLFEGLSDYYNVNNNINYISLFRINDINKDIIYSNINSLKDTVIEFDNEFKLQNQKYYCSEFVVEQIGIKNLKIQKKYVSNIQHRLFIGRDTLDYYPVNIFYKHPNFTKIYEKDFSN